MSKVKFRCDILKDNIAVATLDFLSCQIDCDKDAAIHRTASFVVRDTSGVDLLKDKLRPVMSVWETAKSGYTWAQIEDFARSWEEIEALGYSWRQIEELSTISEYVDYPLGVFLPLSPTRTAGAGLPQEQIDAYDLCAIIREDCLTDRLFIAAGTKYTDAVSNIIISSGIENIEIIPSDKTLTTDREFEIGRSKLDIANELLAEVNYRSVVADANGVIAISPYAQPTMAGAKHIYRADGVSTIKPQITEAADYYNVPNVFIAMVSNSDLEEDLIATYTNDDPSSKLSTVYRGRKIVSEIYQPDGIASQEDLNAYIVRKAFEVSQIEQTVDITTELNPIHGVGDVVFVEHPEITGVFEEMRWSMTLDVNGEMSHTLRRIVTI